MPGLFTAPPRQETKLVILTVTSTLLILVNYYHRFTPWLHLDRLLLYLLVPLAITVLVFRESPGEYGFSLGDWKAGLPITLGAVALLAPLLWFTVGRSPALRSYYARAWQPDLIFIFLVDLTGWEYLFRGWLLAGYSRSFGRHALWLQAVPFALAHIGKPEIETLSTIFGGFAFGWVAWRTRSFIYPLLIHWFVLTFTTLAASGVLG